MAVSKRNAGQAVLEYLLILFVTVALVLGLILQFNESFRTWANNYFGDYLACILETGELPSFGGAVGDSICDLLYEEFTLAGGRPPGGDGGGGEGGSDGGGGSAGGGTGQGEEGASDGRAEYTPVRSGAGSQAGSRGGQFRPMTPAGRSTPAGSGAGGAGGGRDAPYTGSTAVSTPAGLGGAGEDGRPILVRMDTLDRGLGFARDEDRDRERQERVPVASTDDGRDNLRPDRMHVRRRPAAAAVAEEDEGLSFGNILRILLIAAIIIALAIFFGGQALQISKSMD